MVPADPPARAISRLELVQRFFRLGLVAFGGPAAHISMMETEFVSRRKLLTRQAYLDLVAAANLIPGPNSTETVMHVGYRLGGWPGLFLAGLAFILPAATLTLGVAWAYMAGHDLAMARPLLNGIQAGVLAIIMQAVWKLGKKAAPDSSRRFLAVLAALAASIGGIEAFIILGAGLLWMLRYAGPWRMAGLAAWSLPGWSMGIPAVGSGVSTIGIAWVFFKTGALLFGSGYVLVAYLEGDLVHRLGWLTQAELLDAIAMGQFTPGPVLTTATFVGYQLKGFTGALVATTAIFAPSFFFVALTAPIVARLRTWTWAAHFLDGAGAGAVGVMAAVLFRLVIALPHPGSFVLAAAATAFVFWRPSTHPAWIVLGSAILGLLLPV